MNNITKENIEAYILDYIEGNLEDNMRKELEEFLNKNPQYKNLLQEYDPSVRLTDEKEDVFEGKNLLYSDFMQSKTNEIKIIRQNKILKRAIAVITSVAAIFIFVFIFVKTQDNPPTQQLTKTTSQTKTIKHQQTEIKPQSEEIICEEKEFLPQVAAKIPQENKTNSAKDTAKAQLNSNEDEKRYDVVVKRRRLSPELEQLICLVQNEWSDAPEKVLVKEGNILQMNYINEDRTSRGRIDMQMLAYPDNTMIRYVNNGAESSCKQYANPMQDPNSEIVIKNVTLKDLDSIIKVLQNRR
ncbi:MAG: hypothetical protein IJ759_07735 [Bacteroidales bacterium]|nr:hypothetical protein [Bacteroidales bacterium]